MHSIKIDEYFVSVKNTKEFKCIVKASIFDDAKIAEMKRLKIKVLNSKFHPQIPQELTPLVDKCD
jgi:hypothetical protein